MEVENGLLEDHLPNTKQVAPSIFRGVSVWSARNEHVRQVLDELSKEGPASQIWRT